MTELLTCPHDGSTLNSDGSCPRKSVHAKTRVGVACPLCGGPAHKRETDATTQDLQCAWRQYTRSMGQTGMIALNDVSARNFAAWLAGGARSYGRGAQYQALAASHTPLSPAMAHDAARYTPGAAPATTVAAPTPQAQHTPAQSEPEPILAAAPAAPAAEEPDDRRARLRQALAS